LEAIDPTNGRDDMNSDDGKKSSPGGSTEPPHGHHGRVVEEIESVFHVTDADIADYTESVVPDNQRRSNFRMLAQFMSMQAVFGAVLVGYGARSQGLTLSPWWP
jgi:hypothetical protein